MSFIDKYETSTLTPFVKPHNILNLAIPNIFYIQLYMESAFTFNPGSTGKGIGYFVWTRFFWSQLPVNLDRKTVR